MFRSALILLFLLFTVTCVLAQDVTVQQIQCPPQPNGDSPLRDSTVFTGGIVTGVGYRQPIFYFIADRGGGSCSGVLVRNTLGLDTLLAVGDSVRFRGHVEESSSQTRLTFVDSYTRIAAVTTVPPLYIGADSVRETTEGVLVELRNLTVTEIIDDQTFRVTDSTGSVVVEKSWTYSYAPTINEELTFVRGIIAFRNNIFTLNPRGDPDFGFTGNHPPFISNVQNYPVAPLSIQTDTVTASVFDEDGLQSVSVFYRFGENGEYAEQVMHDDGQHRDGSADDGVWGAVLPAGPERTTAYYYIRAEDVLGAVSLSPADAPSETHSYQIRGPTLTIYDLQYTGNPTGGSSPYLDSTVTVTGIVIGTNFGDSFYMCDPGGGLWSGIYVFAPSLTPALGDCVRVTGQIVEYQGAVTEFESGSNIVVLGGGMIPQAIDVRIGTMADSAEAYEGGLVRIGDCHVTSTDSWGGNFPVFEVGDATGRAIIAGDASFEYEPVEGDSFTSIVGCVDYFSNNGWEIAPRFDADIAYVDRRAPLLLGASAVTEHDVNVRFSEALKDSLIENLDNYTIIDLSDPEFPELHLESAYLFSDGRTLHLTTMEVLEEGRAYSLTITHIEDLAGNSLDDAAVSFAGYEPGNCTLIETLYDSFAVYNGTQVMLRGIVTFVQDVTTSSGSRRISAYMQDESGYGFSLSQSGAASTFPGIQRGNFIAIEGIVNEFGGTIQLGSFNGAPDGDVTVLAQNVPLPSPIVIRTGDYRAQRRIVSTSEDDLYGAGTWVQTTGVIYRVDENVGGGTNIAIDDGSGNLTIRVWDSMNLDSVNLNGNWYLLRELVGKTVTVAGPSSTFEGDFQMLAGYAEDFTAQTSDLEPSAEAKLKVEMRPFAPDIGQTLKIEYNAPATSEVRLRVFDLRGRLVATLKDKQAGGPAVIEWDGRTDLRELVPIGTYILHLEMIEGGQKDDIVKPIVVGTKL